MNRSYGKEINVLLNIFRRSGATVSDKDIIDKANKWIEGNFHNLSNGLCAFPKATTALKYLARAMNNQRLSRRLWLKNLSVIKKVLGDLNFTDNRQTFIFDPSQPFTAYQILKEIFGTAKKEILIFDAYVEEGTLDILSKISKTTKLRLITNNVYGKFARELPLFQKEFPNTEVRKFNIHDRFFIIDDDCYILGTSLHSVGKTKPTYLVKTDVEVEKIFTKHFEEIWRRGTVL